MLLMLAISSAMLDSRPPIQIMAGPNFDRLLSGVVSSCALREQRVRHAHPAELLDVADSVAEGLTRQDRAHITRTIARARCANGASCPTAAEIAGLNDVGALPKLVQAVCAKPDSYWR